MDLVNALQQFIAQHRWEILVGLAASAGYVHRDFLARFVPARGGDKALEVESTGDRDLQAVHAVKKLIQRAEEDENEMLAKHANCCLSCLFINPEAIEKPDPTAV